VRGLHQLFLCGVDRLKRLAPDRRTQFLCSRLDSLPVIFRYLVTVLFQGFLGRVDKLVSFVSSLDQIRLGLVLIGTLLGIIYHTVDFLLREAGRNLDLY